jgi:hypothetical protein
LKKLGVQVLDRVMLITLLHPLHQSISVLWKRKASGEDFRLGMLHPPQPNTRPPARKML